MNHSTSSISTPSTSTSHKRLPVAVLISGGGTTLRNLIEKQQSGQLDVDFQLVVSSKQSAGGLQYASDAKIDSTVIAKKDFTIPPIILRQSSSLAEMQVCSSL